MTLPASLTTVTPVSKFVALLMFIALPFAGFYFGKTSGMAICRLNDARNALPVVADLPYPPPVVKKAPDLDTPVAGICSEVIPGQIVTVMIYDDNVPSPRCLKVTADQTLRYTNNSGNPLIFELGSESVTIAPGESATLDRNFGEFLLPGGHLSTGGPEFWLQ